MSDLMAFGKKILSEQPFSILLGAELTACSRGSAELSLTLREDHLQQHGFAHGGVISFLADNALTFAGASVLGPVLTQEMKINYVRPGMGDKLVARAEVLSSGRSQAVCQCKVYSVTQTDEKLCAVAQGTIVVMPKRD